MISRIDPQVPIRDRLADLWSVYANAGSDRTEEEREETERRKLRWDAQTDFHSFMKLMYPGYIEGLHLSQLRDHLTLVDAGVIKRLIVTMPPRHSKSLHVSENFPAWYLGRHPDRRIIAASNTQELANTFSRRVRDKMVEPDWPFPMVSVAKENSSVESWNIEGSVDGGYKAVGRGGTPTGRGGDVIIIDDPIRTQEEADSPTIRQKAWEWFGGTLYTRRQPGAAIILTATRWHEDDLTGRVLEQMRNGGEPWVHLYLPAENELTGDFLWPEFWPPTEYELARNGSTRVWQAQYMGRPSAKEGQLLKREWFPYAPHGERYLAIVQVWDCASEPGLSNDYSVCATIGVSPTSYDILDIWRDKVEFPDLLQAAKDRATWAQMVWYGVPFSLLIENADAGRQLRQMLMAETRLPVEGIPATATNQKVQRVIDVTPLAKAHRIRILVDQPWIQDLLREFAQFPTGAHDDIVDACTIGVRYASGVGGTVVATSRSYVHDSEQEDAPETGFRRPPPPPRRLPPRRH